MRTVKGKDVSIVTGKDTPTTTTEELFHNEWVSIFRGGQYGYVWSHETRCNGRIVAVLPFRCNKNWTTDYLLNLENPPCWRGYPDRTLCTVTGGVENDDPRATAIHEMEEECGYVITDEALIDLGESFGTKSTDTIYSLFAVDVTGMVPGEAKGDGSPGEEGLISQWLSETGLYATQIMDPQVYVMKVRLDINSSYRMSVKQYGGI